MEAPLRIFLGLVILFGLYTSVQGSAMEVCSPSEIKTPCGRNGLYPERICPDIQKVRPCTPGQDVCACPPGQHRQLGTFNCVDYGDCCGGRICEIGRCPVACGSGK